MNPFSTATIRVATQNDHCLPASQGKLLLCHLLICMMFPVSFVILFLVFLVFRVDENVCESVMIAYACIHLTSLIYGLRRFNFSSRLVLPWLSVAAFLLLYNRHWIGQTDDSPFSDGVGTLDQRAFGLLAYLRFFDQSDPTLGRYYIDLTAFACTIEIGVFMLIVFAGIQWLFAPSSADDSC